MMVFVVQVTRKHEGVYECSASNGVGPKAATTKINIRVLKSKVRSIERNERSDFGCLLKLWGTRVCLANFVNQSGFRKLAANQSQVEGNRGKTVGYLDL